MAGTNNKLFIALVVGVLVVGGGYAVWQGGFLSSHPQPLVEGDTITNWNFQSSHNDDGPLEDRVLSEIEKLEEMLEDDAEEPTDYALYVGLAGQYQLLGDGKAAYDHLGKALEIDSQSTGLAWQNLGVLMERLGALNTARIAYGRAVEAQSQIDAYHVARINFLMKHFSNDPAAVEGALAEAEGEFGNDDVFVMQLKAAWYTETGKIQEAIDVWKQARPLVPEELQTGIDQEIERLEKRL